MGGKHEEKLQKEREGVSLDGGGGWSYPRNIKKTTGFQENNRLTRRVAFRRTCLGEQPSRNFLRGRKQHLKHLGGQVSHFK